MKKKNVLSILVASILTVGAFALSGCGSQEAVTDNGKMKVITTIYPVYDVAKAVGGDKVDVTMLVAPGAEPHDWEPTAKDMKAIGKAKLFMYSGFDMEPVEKLLAKDILRDAKAVELAKAAGIKPIPMSAEEGDDHDHDHHDHDHDGDHHDHDHDSEHHDHDHDADHHDHDHDADHHEHDHDSDHHDHDHDADHHEHDHDADHHEHGHHHHHHHGKYDPHVWMSPENVIKETQYTAELFAKEDPANAAYYKENAEKYIAELEKINEELKQWRASADIETLVVSHLAFGYLANEYDLKQEGIMGVAPEAEPTPDRMAEIIDFVKDHHVHAIFTEEAVNRKLADAIAQETGAKVYMLNPLEVVSAEQIKKGDNYITLMQENVNTLKEAFPSK